MSIRLKERIAKPDSTVTVNIDLTNTSDKEIVFFRLAGPGTLYKLNVITKDGKPALPTPLGDARFHGVSVLKGKNGELRWIGGGSVFSTKVEPGKALHDIMVISTYVDLSQPDGYKIQLLRTDPYTNIVVESNTVTLTVAR